MKETEEELSPFGSQHASFPEDGSLSRTEEILNLTSDKSFDMFIRQCDSFSLGLCGKT